MMAFGQPAALLFFLLFIPIILLYLLKQRRRRVQVSTLMFWDAILRDEHSVTSLNRLRKLLSLLLQLLFVTLLALALARPVLSQDLLGARRIVLLLDTSASMTTREKDGTRFELAKREAERVIRSMASGDVTTIVTVAGQSEIAVPFNDSRRFLLDELAKIEVSHGSTDFTSAFQLLKNLPPDSRETWVYVLSDGAFDPVEMEVPDRMKFAYFRAGESKDNVGITAFQLRPLPASPRDFEILFEVANETKVEQRVPFEVRVGGVLVDADELVLAPASTQSRSVRQFARQGGDVEVHLDHQDAFPLDNSAYAVMPQVEPIPVLLVTQGNLFLESALATDEEIALQTQAPTDYADTAAPASDSALPPIRIFDRWAPETTPPGDSIFVGTWPADLGVERTGDLERPVITDWEKEHPVNRHLHLTNIAIESAFRVKVPEGFLQLIKSFDDPVVLLRDNAQGQNLIIAFDTTTSDLPLRVAYPILIANTIRFMASESVEETWESLPVGTILAASELDRYKPRHHVDGTKERIIAYIKPGDTMPDPADSHAGVSTGEQALLAVDRVGVYAMATSDGERVPLFAANLNDKRESEIEPRDTLPLKASKPIPLLAEGFRMGGEPWFYLVLLAFVLCAAEWALYHRRLVE